MTQTTALPQPPRRAPAFADSVRRRVRPRPAPVLGHGWATGGGRPSAAEQVLRPGRVRVIHNHRHTSTQAFLRLAVRFDLGGPHRGGPVRTQWRTAAPSVVDDAQGSGPRTSSAGPQPYPARMELLRARAATMGAVVSRQAAETAGSPPGMQGRAVAGRSAQGVASTVAMIHRSATTTTAAAARGAAQNPSQAAAVNWAADAVGRTDVVAPLTAADLPSVIDRVVGELDRRVTAARERRGWTA